VSSLKIKLWQQVRQFLFKKFRNLHIFSIEIMMTILEYFEGLSNFATPPMKIMVGGAEVQTVDFAVGLLEGDGGVAFAMLSYADHVRLAVIAEKALMSREQLDKLVGYVQNEINELHAIAMLKKS